MLLWFNAFVRFVRGVLSDVVVFLFLFFLVFSSFLCVVWRLYGLFCDCFAIGRVRFVVFTVFVCLDCDVLSGDAWCALYLMCLLLCVWFVCFCVCVWFKCVCVVRL